MVTTGYWLPSLTGITHTHLKHVFDKYFKFECVQISCLVVILKSVVLMFCYFENILEIGHTFINKIAGEFLIEISLTFFPQMLKS